MRIKQVVLILNKLVSLPQISMTVSKLKSYIDWGYMEDEDRKPSVEVKIFGRSLTSSIRTAIHSPEELEVKVPR